MDQQLLAAANLLGVGDFLRALNLIALRDDVYALALRGIAMAQLGDLDRASLLLKRAANAFGSKRPVARARCMIALAEMAFISRDLGWSPETLVEARAILEVQGDFLNAAHAGHLLARRFLLFGRLDEAEQALANLTLASFSPTRMAVHQMIVADLAMRRLKTAQARMAFARAKKAAYLSRIPALQMEIEKASEFLDAPAAQWITRGRETLIPLAGVETLLGTGDLVLDACRFVIRCGNVVVPFSTSPVLFSLARTLAEAWPHDLPREVLIQRTFGAKAVNDSHRIRLRVEIGRLRKRLGRMCGVQATDRGFVLKPSKGVGVHVLAWPGGEQHAAVLALLADGEAWSSSALALALGVSQRTVQRALDALAAEDKVQWFGRGRTRRWSTRAISGFTTTLLLPVPPPDG